MDSYWTVLDTTRLPLSNRAEEGSSGKSEDGSESERRSEALDVLVIPLSTEYCVVHCRMGVKVRARGARVRVRVGG